MKKVFVILALAVVVQQTTASGSIELSGTYDAGSNGNGGSTGGITIGSQFQLASLPSANDAVGASLFEDIFGGFADIGNEILNSFINATQSGQETAKNFIDNLQSSTEIFKEQAEEYAKAVGDDISTALQQGAIDLTSSVQALKLNLNGQIQSLENRVKRGVLTEFEKALEKVNSSALELQNIAGAVNNRYDAQIAQEQKQIQDTWAEFESATLTNVATETENNAHITEKATAVLDEFNNRYSDYLSRCSDEAEKEASAYEGKVQSTIQLYQAVVQQAIVEVQSCLSSDDTSKSNKICQADTRKVLKNLKTAPADFETLIKKGANLLSTNYKRRSCVVQTLVEYKLESYAIQRKINQYIDEYKQIKA